MKRGNLVISKSSKKLKKGLDFLMTRSGILDRLLLEYTISTAKLKFRVIFLLLFFFTIDALVKSKKGVISRNCHPKAITNSKPCLSFSFVIKTNKKFMRFVPCGL